MHSLCELYNSDAGGQKYNGCFAPCAKTFLRCCPHEHLGQWPSLILEIAKLQVGCRAYFSNRLESFGSLRQMRGMGSMPFCVALGTSIEQSHAGQESTGTGFSAIPRRAVGSTSAKLHPLKSAGGAQQRATPLRCSILRATLHGFVFSNGPSAPRMKEKPCANPGIRR